MIYHKVIIVGGGPAGSTCAWKLKQNNIDCIILDKEPFPRNKLCAGWITPKVMRDLQFDPTKYPYSFVTFNRINFHIYGRKIPLRTQQYSIRRCEFDHWLLDRCDVPMNTHYVRNVQRDDEYYYIDNQYRCKYIVGAAGTYCPIYKALFHNANARDQRWLIVAMEDEFTYNYKDKNCHLWFFENHLPGYSWYVPKGNGYLNVGIGGLVNKLRARNMRIIDHWSSFVKQLEKLSLITDYKYSPKGHQYYMRQKIRPAQLGRAYIVGDSAGLATRDMGEGIGSAIQSGLLAADSIVKGTPYFLKSLSQYSIFGILFSGMLAQPCKN